MPLKLKKTARRVKRRCTAKTLDGTRCKNKTFNVKCARHRSKRLVRGKRTTGRTGRTKRGRYHSLYAPSNMMFQALV